MPAARATRGKALAERLARLQPTVKLAKLGSLPRLGNPAATPRMRGRALQERRERWMRLRPLCVRCEERGIVRLWTQLDHVVPLFKGGADDDSNLQGLCDPCHAAKTAADLAGTRMGGAGGNPLVSNPGADHRPKIHLMEQGGGGKTISGARTGNQPAPHSEVFFPALETPPMPREVE